MENNERRKKLFETMKKFNKDHKSEVFSLGSDIKNLEVIPSGVKVVDDFLGGGFKCGANTIVWGAYSSGKTALCLQTIANAQKLGKLVCYVNTEKPIERSRFEFCGVNLDEMIYIEAPENAEKALEAMRTLCREKVIDLFIIDSTNGLCPKSVQEEKAGKERSLEKKNVASLALTLSNFYNIVNSYIFKSKASVVWIGQARTQGIGTFFTRMGLSGGNAQEFYAYQIIYVRRGQNSDAPTKSVKRYFLCKEDKLHYKTEKITSGFDTVFRIDKTNSSKSGLEKSEIHVPYLYDEGFVDEIKEEEEIPIIIEGEGMTPERKEIAKQMLIEKGIITTLPSINNSSDGSIPQKPITEKKEDSSKNAQTEVKPKKKKRGRPKKKKDK